MKIGIESNILRHCLKNAYFITGTAYAGKSTMVKLLAEKHGMIFCRENYHDELMEGVVTPQYQPNLCYFQTMRDWQEFVSREPVEYERWIMGSSKEAGELELALLLWLSASGKKIIVDTNIPLDILREISDYRRVAVMVCPQSLSVERFFERDDPEKRFLLEQINACPDPQATLARFKAGLARINSLERYQEYVNSGFFVLERKACETDTRAQTLAALEAHFGLA